MRGLLGSSMGAVITALAAAQSHKVFTAPGVARAIDKMRKVYRPSNSLAGRRHEHKREIARRQRQAERVVTNQTARAGRLCGIWCSYPAPERISRRLRVLEYAAEVAHG